MAVILIPVLSILGLLNSEYATAQGKLSVWDGVYTEAQARRGEQRYLELCSVCHGQDLGGIEESPGLKRGTFIYNWDGESVGILFQRIRKTMPLTEPSSVSRKIKADILAYIMEENNFPPGDMELPYQTQKLNQINWEAQNKILQ
jgi:mono/diheme cytochrome c family protein